MYTKFEDSGSNNRWEICDGFFRRKKEKWMNKGNDKQENADSVLHNKTSQTQYLYKLSKSYIVQLVRNLWHKFPSYIWVTDGKRKKRKKKVK